MVFILLFMSVLSYQCQNSWSKNLCISVSLTKIWRINCNKLNMVLVIIGAFEVFFIWAKLSCGLIVCLCTLIYTKKKIQPVFRSEWELFTNVFKSQSCKHAFEIIFAFVLKFFSLVSFEFQIFHSLIEKLPGKMIQIVFMSKIKN